MKCPYCNIRPLVRNMNGSMRAGAKTCGDSGCVAMHRLQITKDRFHTRAEYRAATLENKRLERTRKHPVYQRFEALIADDTIDKETALRSIQAEYFPKTILPEGPDR